MSRCVILFRFTEKGIANVKKSPGQSDVFKDDAKRAGATVESIFWTLGAYDGVVVLTAPDEATAVRLTLDLGRSGNVRTTMLRAFDAAEFKSISSKLA